MFDAWQLEFVQRGMAEVVFLGIAGGLLGTWIVLRGLAFFSHAVGAAAFPGLVLADGLAFAPQLGAAGTAGLVAGGVAWLSRRDRERYDSVTALVLVAALAVGVMLASDVFASEAGVESLLFGSLLVVGGTDIALAAVAALAVLLATIVAGPRWLTTGFDPGTARAMGVRSGLGDAVLLALIALVAISMLSAIGALLATALLVVPAATTRLLVRRLRAWQVATVALAIAEGVLGLWISVELNAPPGAAIAVLGGAVFALVAAARALGRPRRLMAAAVAAGAVFLVGCGSSGGNAEGRLSVVATTTILGDIVRQAGGDAVSVTQILKPGSDPHDYEPRPDDVRATAGAAVVVTSGEGLDAWMGDVVDQAGGSPAVLTASEHVANLADDPHWWQDPRNVVAVVPAIRDALATADPEAEQAIVRSAEAYVARLRRLDSEIERCFAARVPASERKLVTDHDAFGHFARRYDIEVVGAVIPSQTTQGQPSAGDLARLAGVIRRERVKAVFPESSLSDRLAQAIARETGATAEHALYADTLGDEGSAGATYEAMMRHNADAMVRGFTGGTQGCS